MKHVKNLLAILIATLLVVAMIPASFAADSASITVNGSQDNSVSVSGKTLTAYKIFAAAGNGEGTSYSWENTAYKAFFKTHFSMSDTEVENITNVVNKIAAIKDNAAAMQTFVVALEAFIVEEGLSAAAVKTAGKNDTSIVFDNLPYGYYLVTDDTSVAAGEVLSGIMLTTVTGDVSINIKASRPELSKVIYTITDDANITWDALQATDFEEMNVKGASASLDNAVWYKLTVTVPNTATFTQGYHLQITDSIDLGRTLRNKIDNDYALKIFVTYADGTKVDISEYFDADGAGAAADGYYYVGTPNAGSTDGIIFDTDAVYKDNMLPAGATVGAEVFHDSATIDLYYAAQLNNYFDFSLTNTATLYYTVDPHEAPSADNRTSISDSAVVYTNLLALSKRAAGAGGATTTTLLPGAEFTVYRTDANKNRIGEALTFYKTTHKDGYPVYMLKSDDDANADALFKLDGTAAINFSALTATTVLKVNSDQASAQGPDDSLWGDDLGTVRLYGLGAGNYEIVEVTAPDGYVLPTSSFYLTVTNTYGPLTGAIIGLDCFTSDLDANDDAVFSFVSSDPNKQHAHFTLTNKSGEALPETGGMGTTIFTVIGLVLMAGAVCFFTLRKRNKA